jgi:hypothetical protein
MQVLGDEIQLIIFFVVLIERFEFVFGFVIGFPLLFDETLDKF